MKKLTILVTALLMGICFESLAFKVIISGGTKDNRFKRIYYERGEIIKCEGRGNNICPVEWSSAGGARMKHNLGEVVAYVEEMVESGRPTGSVNYKEDLPVSWKVLDDNSIEIDISGDVTSEK